MKWNTTNAKAIHTNLFEEIRSRSPEEGGEDIRGKGLCE
jgi:hypothetical protein